MILDKFFISGFVFLKWEVELGMFEEMVKIYSVLFIVFFLGSRDYIGWLDV